MTKRKNPAAVSLGKRGGSIRSIAKSEAARENGKLGGRPSSVPLEERFASRHTSPNEGCWLWTDAKNAGGYGYITVKGKRELAHRVSWMLAHGPIEEGLYVCHRCDVPACVRPDHLFLGTHAENMKDMIEKGRANFVGRPPAAGKPRAASIMIRVTPAELSAIKKRAAASGEDVSAYLRRLALAD